MQCKNCGVENDVNSKFCKECGQKLEQAAKTAEVPQDENVRIGELIYTAYKNKEAGRIEDAILACHGALALNGNSASAHSLLGSLYEARGDITAAIREYERVLELAPESQKERGKLDDLRLGRISPELMPQAREPYFDFKKNAPIMVAVGLFMIVLVISLVLFNRSSKRASKNDVASNQPVITAPGYGNMQSGQYPSQQVGQNQPGQPDQSYQTSQQGAPGQPVTQTQQPVTTGNVPGTQSNGASTQRNGNLSSGRNTYPSTAPTNIQIRPIEIPRSTSTAQPPKESPVIVPIITPNEGTGSVTYRPLPPTPEVRINPQPVYHMSPPAAVDPEAKALKLQSQGKYQDAVSAYKDALPKAKDQGRIYQSIALCQQRLGQNNQAVDNYTHAIKAYKDQLAAGRDASEVQRNIRACEAGIQVNKE